MADFIVDPNGNVQDVRSSQSSKTPSLSTAQKPEKPQPQGPSKRGRFVRNIGILALGTVMLIEVYAGYKLFRIENQLQIREITVLGQEKTVDKEMAALTANKRTVTDREKQLEALGNKLEIRDQKLKVREHEDEEKSNNHSFALWLARIQINRIRSTFERQQIIDRSWPQPSIVKSDTPQSSSAASDTIDSLNMYESCFRLIENSHPVNEFEIAGRAEALAEMASACVDLIARGSIGSYGLQATIETDLEILKDLARCLELPSDCIPQNLFELLDSHKLLELQSLQIRKIEEIKRLEPSLLKLALEHEEAILGQIKDSIGKRPVNPCPLFAEAILTKTFTAHNITLLRIKASESARAAAINLRETQLLAKRLAIDDTNVAVRLRFKQLMQILPQENKLEYQSIETMLTITEQIQAASPKNAVELCASLKKQLEKKPSSISDAIVKYIESRYSDPLKAAELFVLLDKAYESQTSRSADANPSQFFRWMAGHLTRGQLYKLIFLWIQPTIDIIDDIKIVSRSDLLHPEDQVELVELRKVFIKEAAERPKASSLYETRLKTPLIFNEPPSPKVYNVIRKYYARTPSVTVKSALLTLALEGIAVQLDTVDANRAAVEQAVKENEFQIKVMQNLDYEGYGEFYEVNTTKAIGRDLVKYTVFNKINEAKENIYSARNMLFQSYNALQLRLNELNIFFPDNAQWKIMLQRVNAGLAAIPPPTPGQKFSSKIKTAMDWADPNIFKWNRKIEQNYLPIITSLTENIKREVKKYTHVEVIGTDICSRTHKVKKYLEDKGFKVQIRDIRYDSRALLEVQSVILKNNELPLVIVNSKSINGSGEDLCIELKRRFDGE